MPTPDTGGTDLETDTDGTGSGAWGEAGALEAAAHLGVRSGPPVPFGMAADADERRRVEEETGAAVPVVRIFTRWDTAFPTVDQQALLDEGRVVHLSIRPRTDGGRDIGWAELAAATPGTALGDELDRWVRAVADAAVAADAAGRGGRLYLTFNHEPETAASTGHGTAADFRAAWRTVTARLRAAPGGDRVRTVLVLSRGTYATGGAEAWWPGDDVVDVVGVDAYNWFDCQAAPGAPARPWVSPAELLAPARAFARAHAKPLAVPETASTDDPADTRAKADWILDLARTLASPDGGVPVEFAAWFPGHDPSWPRCQWAWDSTPAAARAMADALTWLAAPSA